MTDRAVSEVVGFVLVFGLIVTTIRLVYASGIPVLTDARDVERVNNAERAFDVLADNAEAVTQRGAPDRATEIKLADAGLRMDEHERMEVVVDPAGAATTYSIGYRPIVYDAGTGTKIVYANGSVIRDQPRGNLMVREPALRIAGDRSVIQFVETRRDGQVNVGGSRTVLVRTEHVRSSLLGSHTDGPHTVELRIVTSRTQAWTAYLESFDAIGENTCDEIEGEQVTCTFDTDELHVPVTRIDVSVS